ncbi:hypothetical protein NDU88_006273 [Pleurodeles waltl]|uniref:Uncharacterized protein n=1 Tax=Pleurodeles waltl TaxID=8319 RepID=A0AAV7UKI1_PLEWA|nr:hypothetical protein NDU88_006273 [Pleurodeles waltl]
MEPLDPRDILLRVQPERSDCRRQATEGATSSAEPADLLMLMDGRGCSFPPFSPLRRRRGASAHHDKVADGGCLKTSGE